LEDRLRVTLDFSRYLKVLPSYSIELSLKVYNNLLNLKYNILIAIDLKYTYLTIGLYPDNRYIFAFIFLASDSFNLLGYIKDYS